MSGWRRGCLISLLIASSWVGSVGAQRAPLADIVPPTITFALTPEPNGAGWNNTPVTVTFSCVDDQSGVASCPPPMVIDTDGAAQSRTVTASDQAGNESTTTVVVNIDTHPAAVSLTSPVEGQTTTADTIELTGLVGDSVSNISAVKCNDATVGAAPGLVQCTVPLQPGVNVVVLHVMDEAGNSSSAAVRVARTGPPASLTVWPRALTVPIDGVALLVAADEFGVASGDVTWTSTDPAAIKEVAGSSAVLRARTPGVYAVTARVGSLSAEATVTVTEGASAFGTPVWTGPLVSVSAQSPIWANRVDDIGSDLFAVSEDPSRRQSVVHALEGRGYLSWTATVPGIPLFGDRFGGLVVGMGGETDRHALLRVDRMGGAPSWRYESQGRIRSDVTQAEDGTIYLIETVSVSPQDVRASHDQSFAVALDGKTGLVKFRQLLSASTFEVASGCGAAHSVSARRPPTIGELSSDARYGYVQLLEAHDGWRQACDNLQIVIGGGTVRRSRALSLLRLSPQGAALVRTLWKWGDEGPDTVDRMASDQTATPGRVVPDDVGGIIATWTLRRTTPADTGIDSHVTRLTDPFGAGRQVADKVLASSESSLVLLDAAGLGYFRTGSVLSAADLRTWTTKWSLETTGQPILALDGGGVVVNDEERRELLAIDQEGRVVSRTPARIKDAVLLIHSGDTLHGVEPETGAPLEISVPGYREAGWYAVVKPRSR